MAKTIQILRAIAMMLGGVLLAMGMSFVTLVVIEGSSTSSDSTGWWVMFALMPIALWEAGAWYLVKSVEMGQVTGGAPTDVWSVIAKVRRVTGLAGVSVGFVLLLALGYIGVRFLANKASAGSVVVSDEFRVLATVWIAYAVLRIPLVLVWRRVGPRLQQQLRKGQARYEVLDGSVMIELPLNKPPSKERVRVRIGFDELDEVRHLTRVEADTYLEYQVGPNVELAAEQTRGLYRFLSGEIDRPPVYAIHDHRGPIVLLRGRELFYMLNFDAENVSDLVDAFAAFRGGGPSAALAIS